MERRLRPVLRPILSATTKVQASSSCKFYTFLSINAAMFRLPSHPKPSHTRQFTCSALHRNWLFPKRGHSDKNRKGRPRVPTGGSTRGTTVVWGDYGLRLLDHDRRISSKHLQLAADTIKRRLRGLNFRLYTRVSANIGVYTSGNEMRMGKGKGSFDHWAARVAVSQILFELKGDCHEQVLRDALRLAGNKLPGTYECVKRGDPPVMGITKMREGMTIANMTSQRAKLPADITAGRIPATMPGPLPTFSDSQPSAQVPS